MSKSTQLHNSAERTRKWRKNNPERTNELARKYYARDRDKVLETQRLKRRGNPKYYGGMTIGYANSIVGWSKYKTNSLIASAKKRGHEFDITYKDILSLVTNVCPVLGIRLDYSLGSHKKKILPSSPSVDRIDNTKGYVKGNIIIVSQRANKIKYDLRVSEITPVLTKIIKHYRRYN